MDLDEAEFARWRRAADRAMAAVDAQAVAGLHEWACFQAEQAAQLAIKALLHGVGAEAWGHDLAGLAARAAAVLGDEWGRANARAAEVLSRFYLPTRYPDAVPDGIPGDRYDEQDTAAALAAARQLIAAVDDAWRGLHR